ncbi:MAG: hypothetical protein IJ775_04760 [Muribaculaceae bacterium]|nr:hypothetical protein [Muribaculaceae bacterium]
MKHYIWALSLIFALVACTGSGNSDGDNRNHQPKRAHELRFMREVGVNPDSMLVTDSWTLPEGDDWETEHHRWLNMNQITTLGLDQLCDADTSMSPITLQAVYPIDEHLTMLILHQYLGDSAPVRIVTYDGDGIPMDHLSLGTCQGVNTIYWNDGKHAAAAETATLAFAGRNITVERQLQMRTAQGDVLWTATGSDTYEIDNRGYILHREAKSDLSEMTDEFRTRRAQEAAGWYSIQDEQAMDALSACANGPETETSTLGIALWQRLLASPWTTAHWLYTHQDSPLVPQLAKESKSVVDNDDLKLHTLEAVHDPDQKAFLKKILLNK